MDTEPQGEHQGAGEIDLNKILLPKKEGPSVDSAQRVDAGTLLAQEQNATLERPVEPTQQPSDAALAAQPGSAPASKTSIPISGIQPLQTFQSDIASVVQTGGVSVVSIAAAEANRRGGRSISDDSQAQEARANNLVRNLIFVCVGIVLLAAAGGLIFYISSRNAPLPAQTAGVAPFITIDGTTPVTIPQGADINSTMEALVNAKNSVSISLGLVEQLYVQAAATSGASAPAYVDAQTLLSLLAPSIPATLLRDIQPVYLLGVHSYGVNQPFLILKVDSYEQAYAGMLAWETTMKSDLSPLFSYTPPPVISSVPVSTPVATTTSTSTDQAASTSNALPQNQLLDTGFTDMVVDNHDARVLEDQYGTVDFLWTFLDRQTVLITTTPETLQEVLSRLTTAPVTSLPTTQ